MYVKDKKVVLNFCLLACFLNATLVPLNSFQSPLVVDVLGQGSGLLSAIGIAEVLGMGLGSALFPYFSGKCKARGFVFVNGIGMAVCMAGIVLGSLFRDIPCWGYVVTSVIAFGLLFFTSTLSAFLNVMFLKCVDSAYLARAAALLGACCTAAMPVTSFAVSIVVKYVPVREILIASGVICGIFFIAVWLLKVPLEEGEA